MESNTSTSVRPVYHSPTREARRAVINRSNTSTSCFDSISDMHTRRAHSQRKLLVLGTCNLTTYKFSFSSYASTCNLLKPEQLQQKIY